MKFNSIKKTEFQQVETKPLALTSITDEQLAKLIDQSVSKALEL